MLKIIANYKYLLLLVVIALAAYVIHSVANRIAESYQQKRRALSIPAKIAVVALDGEPL